MVRTIWLWKENTCWEIGEVRVLPFLNPWPVTVKRKITFQGHCRTLQNVHVVLVRYCMWTQLHGWTTPRKFPILEGGKLSLALRGSAALLSFLWLPSPNWTAAMTIPDTWHWTLSLSLSTNLWPPMPIYLSALCANHSSNFSFRWRRPRSILRTL